MAIIFKGLNRNETYLISFQDGKEQNTSMTGAELMDQGILVKGMIGQFASRFFGSIKDSLIQNALRMIWLVNVSVIAVNIPLFYRN